MKQVILSMLLINVFSGYAATNITTPIVSGTWTPSGSPYIVHTIINVPLGQTLTINPGVTVKFMPNTMLTVDGSLVAKGTVTLPVFFRANDTTGWSNGYIDDGGWGGILLSQYYGGSPDVSALEYCIIQDCKLSAFSTGFNSQVFSCQRSLKIKNTNFIHNTTGVDIFATGVSILTLNTLLANDTIELNNCEISDAHSEISVISSSNVNGFTYIHHSRMHHNEKGSTFNGTQNNLLFENNEIYNNEVSYGGAPIYLFNGTVKFRNNKVHHNTIEDLAAVSCLSGKVDIDNNLICNNQQLNGNCPYGNGGGGIHLGSNGEPQNSFYRIRNNVIANNYANFGGGGVHLFGAKVSLVNNQIVNNTSLLEAPAIGAFSMSELFAKNNLLYGNQIRSTSDSIEQVYCNGSQIHFDYNYIPNIFSKVVKGSSFIVSGDTSHNVIGNLPNMVSPTSNNLPATNALNANFSLQSTSPCINKGDTVNAAILPTDFLGSNRYFGSKIDIGAFEYQFEITEVEHQMNVNEKTLFTFFPNPTQHVINITTQTNQGQLYLLDVSGKVIFEKKITQRNTSLEIPKLPTGIYLLKYHWLSGVSSQKLFIQ